MFHFQDSGGAIRSDPFYESQENHNLIGVANIFLSALFHDVPLEYAVPIISQQGEVAGRLYVELARVSGSFPEDRQGDADSESEYGSGESNRNSMIEAEDEQSGAMTSSSTSAGSQQAQTNSIVTRVRGRLKALPSKLTSIINV